ETLELAMSCLEVAGICDTTVDLADVRIVRILLSDMEAEPQVLREVYAALAAKDASELDALTRGFPRVSREGFQALVQMYGDASVLQEAEAVFRHMPRV